MLSITADPAQVARTYGLDARKSLLFSAIRLDSHPFVAPLIARTGDEEYLLVRQQEQGNALSAGVPKERMKFYAPWVTIDPRVVADTPAAESLVSLVRELAQDGPVHLAADVVYTHYRALSGSVDLVAADREPVPVTAYELDRSEVIARFAQWRRTGVDTARRLIEGVPHLAGLEAEFTSSEDSRFAALEALVADRGLDALLLAAPPNFTEATGFAQPGGAVALWLAGSGKLLVLAGDEATGIPGASIGRYPSVGAAVRELAGGPRTGVEEEFVSVGLARELEREGAELIGVSHDLGHWRDIRDHEDLAFQVVAARASVFAIEEALAWAEAGLDAGRSFTELDINAVYLDKIIEFRTANDIPFGIEPYFTNLHSSNRMLFPGPPVDFPIDAETTCIQLDAGVRIVIDGVIVATSDMARSLPRTPAAKEAYAFFFDVVREGIIGQLRPGVICEDVHEGTLRYLAPHLDRMVEIGMLGTEVDFNTEYRKRNVGHLMGKQESFANELRPGYKHALDIGSYGAAEIPWRYDNAAIGTEDLWYIGRDRTYIVSKR
ncbi:aminopeptidase P family N-terminal domain-containing protein [Nocardia zapadnayensis]|uniref:aminopeptidase P family N-terminal domain-containing protein n=1 Tax=Nocardia rhamnosiphila TaxID=426716 RepID=UPI00224823B0|nr:aminopeptidase P family N-terminal domain-containing protein [Nocardia zapadnayensis]MCX0271695.1 aminopeptidase P family N-terminal domain-containing protein [Nocardia zapadnayensis]